MKIVMHYDCGYVIINTLCYDIIWLMPAHNNKTKLALSFEYVKEESLKHKYGMRLIWICSAVVCHK